MRGKNVVQIFIYMEVFISVFINLSKYRCFCVTEQSTIVHKNVGNIMIKNELFILIKRVFHMIFRDEIKICKIIYTPVARSEIVRRH